MTETLLAVQGLSVEFGARAQPYRAVKSLTSPSAAAKRWRWWASPAPANR